MKKELQSTIAELVGKAGSSMKTLSLYSGKDIARSVRSAKDSANSAVSELEKKGEIAARACKSLGIDKLDDSIKYAKQLKADGKVYGKDKWIDVVRGTSDADKQVRSELANMQQPVVDTGTATTGTCS